VSPPDVTLRVVDDQGRTAGVTDDGAFVNEITGASSPTRGESRNQRIHIPAGVEVDVVASAVPIQRYLEELPFDAEVSASYHLTYLDYGPNPTVRFHEGRPVATDVTIHTRRRAIQSGDRHEVGPPLVDVTVDPRDPAPGEEVTVTASMRSDAALERDALTFEWDLTQNGRTDARGPRGTRTYETAGTREIRLEVLDRETVVETVSHVIDVRTGSSGLPDWIPIVGGAGAISLGAGVYKHLRGRSASTRSDEEGDDG